MDSKLYEMIDTLMGYINMYLKITASYVYPTNFLVKNACRAFHPSIPNQCASLYQFFSVHWKNRLISCKKFSMTDIVPASRLKPQSPTAVLLPVSPSHFFHLSQDRCNSFACCLRKIAPRGTISASCTVQFGSVDITWISTHLRSCCCFLGAV